MPDPGIRHKIFSSWHDDLHVPVVAAAKQDWLAKVGTADTRGRNRICLRIYIQFERDISPSEAKASENLMRIISTFSRTGVPQVSDGTPWPRFDEEKRYMDIRKEGNFPQKLLLKSVCDLWEKVRPYE
ncbi:hypothetical protein HPB48_012688 [Haemaphysalis longicornis]|uniref:Uncharacterized protein n=1 Tax=Haemaphysalis longicornis TaxID=44386 RepID=A0A9J6FQA9_HAELO|nr:hypothetical protein HPB48_012688 [Haemaphysalis longicornis]